MDTRCSRELTRTYSNSSDITVESSHHTANVRLQGQSAEWTNEMHNAYLNFLEATFVHQLRSSIGLRGRCTRKNVSWPCSSQSCYSSDQDGDRKKIKFKVNETYFDESADSHVMLESPQICRLTPVGKQQTATSFAAVDHDVLNNRGLHLRENKTLSREPAGSSKQHLDRHLCHLSSDDCAMEVSDQNFVDEDQIDKSSYYESTAKRLKTAGVDDLNNDQVSLVARLHSPDANLTPVIRASSERQEHVHQDLLSKHPKSFASPRSNMHHFLRGS